MWSSDADCFSFPPLLETRSTMCSLVMMQIRDDRVVKGKWERVCEHAAPAEHHLPPDTNHPLHSSTEHLLFCPLIYNCTTPLLKSSALVQGVHKNARSGDRNKTKETVNSIKQVTAQWGENTHTLVLPLSGLKASFFCQKCQNKSSNCLHRDRFSEMMLF